MSKFTSIHTNGSPDPTPAEYEPSGAPLPSAPSLRDDPARLTRAMNEADRAELRAELEAEIRATIEQERRQAEEFAEAGDSRAQEAISARGRLRAMGIQGVVEARKLEGRDEEPWTNFDADVAYAAADLFLTACGLGAKVRAQGVQAVIAKPSPRKLSPAIEAGIAASAGANKEDSDAVD
jgi:hypothetical protein